MAARGRHVVDVDERGFRADVVDVSMKTLVVVDFWAEWCGPCKTLGPVLEGLAEEYGGAFRLAKVDVDRNPNLAAQAGAQSIPTVLAVWQGAVVDSFVGALPKTEVKRWLDRMLDELGVKRPEPEAKVPDDPAQAERHWRRELEKDAKNGRALLELGRLLFRTGREEEAVSTLQKVTAQMPEFGAAQATLALRELLAEVEGAGGEDAVRRRGAGAPSKAGGDPEGLYLVALADAVRGDFVPSLEALVGLSGSAPAEVRDRARKAAATVFEVAGRDQPEIEAQRRRLARLLF